MKNVLIEMMRILFALFCGWHFVDLLKYNPAIAIVFAITTIITSVYLATLINYRNKKQ